jgi:membrane protein
VTVAPPAYRRAVTHAADPEPRGALRRWWAVAGRVKDNARKDNLTLIAGGVAFFSLLSAIPALAAVVALYGLVADPKDVVQRVNELTATMPPEARALLDDQLQSLTTADHGGLGFGLVLGLLLALWGASTAMQQLTMALSAVSQHQESRGYVKLRLRALALTASALVFAAILVGLLAVLPIVAHDGPIATTLTFARWPLLAVLMLAALSVLYRFAPDQHDARWQWISPGSVLATGAWLVASALFTAYAGHFDSYTKTYGALAGVVMLMLWLFITAMCVLIGAEINAARAEVAAAAEPTDPSPERSPDPSPGPAEPAPDPADGTDGARGTEKALAPTPDAG